MCYILLAVDQSEEYPFILAANRDEFYQRESARLQLWPDKPDIAGGRDLEQGGTWMAAARSGRFAAITNYREAGIAVNAARSRGLLITDFLESQCDCADFSDELARRAGDYSGYNLIYGELPERLFYFSNRSDQPPLPLAPGIHSLSNHLLNTPWPKVVRGKLAFEQIIRERTDSMVPALFRLLADRTTAGDHELPDTGVGRQFERLLSSIFIEGEQYGTRCSSVITVDRHHQLNFSELTHRGDAGPVDNPVTLGFRISPVPVQGYPATS